MTETHTEQPEDNDLAAPLDTLLADAANGARRFLPGPEYAVLATALARRPSAVARRTASWAAELARIQAGLSDVAPSKRDRRFSDEAWSGNPLLRRILQSYLVTGDRAHQLLADLPLDERSERRLKLALEMTVDALAPSNFGLLNPTVAKATLDTGGANLVRGARNMVSELSRSPHVPAMVDESAFEVGGNIALTPGAVVLRTELFELIQYQPVTETVASSPVLMVPPMINKFYVLDLAPGRSMVEHLVSQGNQVFMISWRNPHARHAEWSLDDYVGAVIEALDATKSIAHTSSVVMHGTCAGGILSAIAAAHLSAIGRADDLAGLALAVTVLDQARAGTTAALMSRRRATMAAAASKRVGYLDGKQLSEMFAWLRPNDLVWNYWVNNYLLGKKPPAFDVLFWNADSTRMPAALHRDFLELSVDNKLTQPGSAEVLGTPIDLRQVECDTYLIGGETDHITPWASCYKSTNLLGGKTRFILSTSGHIAALVNPADNEKSSFRTTDDAGIEDPAEWAQKADSTPGSWWVDYAGWLGDRTGPQRKAPKTLGRGSFRVLADAPGTYVLDT